MRSSHATGGAGAVAESRKARFFLPGCGQKNAPKVPFQSFLFLLLKYLLYFREKADILVY
jgi:hypothetical protein